MTRLLVLALMIVAAPSAVAGETPTTQAPPATGATQPTDASDATLPQGIALGWDANDVHALTDRRNRVNLDGVWKFVPAEGSGDVPPAVGWAYLKVPGSWQSTPNHRSDFIATGGGKLWDTYDGSKVSRAWYERKITIPPDWITRTITLHFACVSTDAIVYVNGKRCGHIEWPWGQVEITSAVKPGETADLRVLVAAIADAGKVGTFWQNALSDTSAFSSAKLKTRGLTGSVFLESRTTDAHISDVFVQTPTRKKQLTLDVDLARVKQPGPVHFTAEMLNEKGEVEKTFSASASVDAKPTQILSLSWPWENPRLWDVGKPNLYTLRLTAKGAGVDDQINQQFGFREFWADGRKLFLNGSEIHLRQGAFYYGPKGQVGDDFWEIGSQTVDTRGDPDDSTRALDDADRRGYLVAQYVLDCGKYMIDSRRRLTWTQNRDHAMDRAAVWMRHYRNHPSVVMWIAGFNFFNNAVDADPRHIGRRDWEESPGRWQQLMADAKDMFQGLRALDPTRLYYSHAGAYTGDVYTMNCYLDLIPLQEREEWLSQWAADGQMPVSMVEFGTPVDCTFRRGHNGFTTNITSEPLLTEYAAIYLGNDAYTAEEPKYRKFLHDLFRQGMLYESSENKLDDYANNHKIQQLFRTNTWRSWRTAGLPGGMRTWSWNQDALKQVNGPTLAWIAGPPNAYTAKDHHFTSGQQFEKQIVAINDTREPQEFTAHWAVEAAGKQIDFGAVAMTLRVAEIRFLPIHLTAPPVTPGEKIDARITLDATIGNAKHTDIFPFRVFSQEPPARESDSDIAVVDPAGLTINMLHSLGHTTHPWDGGPSPLLVVGRNALKDTPGLAERLEKFVHDGGRALICAQDPTWMQQALGFRVCPHVSRRVFPTNNSVTDGIDAEDLRDWTGQSTLIESHPQYIPGTYLKGNEGDQPYAGWHWGNRGGVTSAAIEKPHRSAWRPLLECEFDLSYSPLMELDYARGRLTLCTLDLEDHVATDPAARRLAQHILNHAQHAPLSPRAQKVLYIGGPDGAAWLDRIGVNYDRSSTLDPAAQLALIGPDATIDDPTLQTFLQHGRKVFALPRSADKPLMGTTLKQAPEAFAGSLSPPTWPEAAGLSASDLRWRSFTDQPPLLLDTGAEIGANGLLARKAVGTGTAIFCQIDPDHFHADDKTYFRYTRWRSTRAVAQLLENLGATFPVDQKIFHPLQMQLKQDWSRHPPQQLNYYHPDYLTEFFMGDNPYRYYRW